MDFALTEEQQFLVDTARDFVDRTCPPEVAQQWDESDHYPVELFRGMADMGWIGLPFPEEDGGGGGGAIELCLLAEQLGRASLDIAMCFIGNLISSLTLYKFGTPEQRERYLPALMAAKRRFAIAISEPDHGSDAAGLRTRAVDQGDHFLVNGEKAWCTGAGLPGTLIAMYVRTGSTEPKHEGLSMLLVDPEAEGVTVKRTPTLARHILGTNEVILENVRVPKENLVHEVNRGWDVMLSSLELERVLMSGAYVGTAQACVDEAVAYGMQREQFGRKVATFQAIAHALVDMQVEVDSARLLARRAAWMLANGLPCSTEGSMAKLKGSETYVNAARLGMQVFAGHGFATESTMSFRYRESIVATISGGTSQIQRNGIARGMGLGRVY